MSSCSSITLNIKDYIKMQSDINFNLDINYKEEIKSRKIKLPNIFIQFTIHTDCELIRVFGICEINYT